MKILIEIDSREIQGGIVTEIYVSGYRVAEFVSRSMAGVVATAKRIVSAQVERAILAPPTDIIETALEGS